MKKITIRQLMFVVFMVAVLLTLGTRPSQAWSSVIISITVFFLATAALLACVRRDKNRIAWTGFAIFGWAYVIIGIGPKFDCLDSPMITNAVLRELFLHAVDGSKTAVMNDETFISAYRNRALEFFQIGHSVFALLSGVVGATCAVMLYRNDSDDLTDSGLRAR
jgi:hypothetical protein